MTSTGKRTKVLVFIDWYLPAIKAGGPVRSLEAIVSRLASDVEFTVITGNTDAGSEQVLSGIESDVWTKAPDGTSVFYCSRNSDPTAVAIQLMQRVSYDCIYFNSVFSSRFTIRPLMKLKKLVPHSRIVLAPRGMLGEGALQIKAFRKKIFFIASRFMGLYRGIHWHASTEQEAGEVKSVFGDHSEIIVAPNLTSISPLNLCGRIKASGQLNLVFISRISPKKNLLLAIQALGKVKGGNIHLDVYGPKEDENYAQQCLQLAASLSPSMQVKFNGTAERSQLETVFRKSHFMILPTLHENFGHVIIESLAMSCPVMISKHTPWNNLRADNAGMNCELNADAFVSAINEAVSMDNSEYAKWEKGAFVTAERFLKNDDSVNVMLKVFVNS